jgi:hypothetical protein
VFGTLDIVPGGLYPIWGKMANDIFAPK